MARDVMNEIKSSEIYRVCGVSVDRWDVYQEPKDYPVATFNDKAAALKTLQASQSAIDRVADKKVVHKNLASRTKSRLAHAIKAMT